jgi:hypothetical protein
MKAITIDELSIGDVIMINISDKPIKITDELLCVFSDVPELLRQSFRIPCTAENTKTGDWVYDSTEDVIHLFNGYHQHHFRPLKKELAAHLESLKPTHIKGEFKKLMTKQERKSLFERGRSVGRKDYQTEKREVYKFGYSEGYDYGFAEGWREGQKDGQKYKFCFHCGHKL